MTNSSFDEYARGGFGPDLLPIIPPDATIALSSPDPDALRQKRGKIPGVRTPNGWFGFARWTRHLASPEDLTVWGRWGASVGLQGRHFPGVDIDIDDARLADAVHELAVAVLGDAPCRFGNGPRRLLAYAGADLAKRRIEFRQPGAPGQDDVAGAVEILGHGQQYVVEGIHPKTGTPYRWSEGRSPAVIGADSLRRIDTEMLDTLEAQLRELLALRGCKVMARASSTGRHASSSTWQGGLRAPSIGAIERALAALPNDRSYDEWIMLLAAIKAGAGPEREGEAFELAMTWSLQWPDNTPEGVEAKWGSIHPPYRVGWDTLAQFAETEGDGTFYRAHEDFEATMPPPEPGQESKGPLISDKVERAFGRYVWVERLKRMCDLETGDLLDREQFNVRNSHLGDPASHKDCAWSVLTRDARRLQTVKGVTYRPGAGLLVDENLPGLVGRCVNQWRDPSPALPATASDADVEPWLQHVAFVIPRAEERETALNWLAWIIQNPGLKPNWALVIGSTYEGIGKDLMMEPVRTALGAANVREITPDDLDSNYTWYLARTRLVLVEEMKLSDRKATMNRLKPLLAAPPYTLSVNAKFEPQYEIPNVIASVFFTNDEDALAISGQDRRYFMLWSDEEPRSAGYYEDLVRWYKGGGAALAARWLLDRDISAFKPEGRAPDTEAKSRMRAAALPALEATIHDGVANREGPFARRLVALGEVQKWVTDLLGYCRAHTPRRVSGALKAAGALQMDRRITLGQVPPGCSAVPFSAGQNQLYAMPGDQAALDLSADIVALRAAFWSERSSLTEFSADIFEDQQ